MRIFGQSRLYYYLFDYYLLRILYILVISDWLVYGMCDVCDISLYIILYLYGLKFIIILVIPNDNSLFNHAVVQNTLNLYWNIWNKYNYDKFWVQDPKN